MGSIRPRDIIRSLSCSQVEEPLRGGRENLGRQPEKILLALAFWTLEGSWGCWWPLPAMDWNPPVRLES